MSTIEKSLEIVAGIPAVRTILDVVCRTTEMGFAAVARVTEDRWIACSVLDNIDFGLEAGGELEVESTICHEIRQSRQPVIIEHVAQDQAYCDHHTPKQYGFQSYISMPIFLPNGEFFGTLCAIDPKPARVNTPEITGMFKLFAELIAFHVDAAEKLEASQSSLEAERRIAEVREKFIGVLGHDLRTPLGAISMGITILAESAADDEQTRTLEMMRRSTSRMSDLIEETLDFTRGRLGGGIALVNESEQLVSRVLEQGIEEARLCWPNRPIAVEFTLKERVSFDSRRISQLFTNLLSNAMVHGKPDHPVKVKATSANGRFELSVANATAPIPDPTLERMFEPFSASATTKPRSGLGLGLYIASEIAKAHGGVLTAEQAGGEVIFTFAMPTSGGLPLQG